MRVRYPYCRRCGKSRTKKEEQTCKDIGKNKPNGGITTHERTYCAICNGLLSWKPKAYGKRKVGDMCPDCKNKKSWLANRCRMCHAKFIREHPSEHYTHKQKFNDDFKKRLRQKIDEIKTDPQVIAYLKLKSQRRNI